MDKIYSVGNMTKNVAHKSIDTVSDITSSVVNKTRDVLSSTSEAFDTVVNNTYDRIINNRVTGYDMSNILVIIVGLFLILYVPFVRPSLPKFVEHLFENPLFRICIYAYIIYRANHDPMQALVIACVFMITIMMINKMNVNASAKKVQKKTKEHFIDSYDTDSESN